MSNEINSQPQWIGCADCVDSCPVVSRKDVFKPGLIQYRLPTDHCLDPGYGCKGSSLKKESYD